MVLSTIFWVVFCPTLFAVVAYRKRSVSLDGAIAGWIVAFVCALAGAEFLLTLLFFFITSTILTKMGAKRKMEIDSEYKVGGQRNSVQVFCNGFAGTIACTIYAMGQHDERSRLCLAACFIGHYACCCGDTWASECGTAFKESILTRPVLITTLKPVPIGTNGGVSILGTLASAAGGLAIGLAFWAAAGGPLGPWALRHTATIGLLSGFGGSMVDSLLGACFQYSGLLDGRRVVNQPSPAAKRISGMDLLDNHQVNFLSSLTAAAAAAAATAALYTK